MAKKESVPILLPRAPRNFPDAKTRNGKKFDRWPKIVYSLEIIWAKINFDLSVLFSVSCFSIGEVHRSPGKRNWKWLTSLPFTFIFGQREVLQYVLFFLEYSRCITLNKARILWFNFFPTCYQQTWNLFKKKKIMRRSFYHVDW